MNYFLMQNLPALSEYKNGLHEKAKKKKITETTFNGPGHVDLILTDKILFEAEFLFSRLIFETV